MQYFFLLVDFSADFFTIEHCAIAKMHVDFPTDSVERAPLNKPCAFLCRFTAGFSCGFSECNTASWSTTISAENYRLQIIEVVFMSCSFIYLFYLLKLTLHINIKIHVKNNPQENPQTKRKSSSRSNPLRIFLQQICSAAAANFRISTVCRFSVGFSCSISVGKKLHRGAPP